MKKKRKILLVEDDQSLGYILREYLVLNDFSVDLIRDGEEGLKAFVSGEFDACIVDVVLPKKDGFTLVSEIRQVNKTVPVVFLTAKSLKVDKLKGFKLGADDYLTKPVDEEELIARVHAILRRSQKIMEDTDEEGRFWIGKYIFDFKNQELQINGQKKVLTTRETEILKILCENEGKLLERKTVLRKIWGETDFFARRSMDVFISRLRRYLQQDSQVKIENVRGRGFILQIKKG